MTQEIGTLSELNVKPGDCVGLDGDEFDVVAVYLRSDEPFLLRRKDGGCAHRWAGISDKWYIISRATPPVDLTAIREPFGLLLEHRPEVAAALKAHGGMYQVYVHGQWSDHHGMEGANEHFAWRVKPAPKVETVTVFGHKVGSFGNWTFGSTDGADTHRITFDLIDGEPDVSSVRMVKL